MQGRIKDIRDVLALINGALSSASLSAETKRQLLVFRTELEAELRLLLADTELLAA